MNGEVAVQRFHGRSDEQADTGGSNCAEFCTHDKYILVNKSTLLYPLCEGLLMFSVIIPSKRLQIFPAEKQRI